MTPPASCPTMTQSKQYYSYLMTNKWNTVFYNGVTDNLIKRIWEHKNKVHPKSFTAKYNVYKLVYYEIYSDPLNVIKREKQIKNLVRRKKIELIILNNPEYRDLYDELV